MSTYLKNMDFLRERLKPVHDTILKEKPLFSFTIEETEDDSHNYVLENERARCFIHSIYSIPKEMENLLKPVDPDTQILILFGFGCGYAFDYLREKLPWLEHVIVIEPILQLFLKVLQKTPIEESIKNSRQMTLILNKEVIESVQIITQTLIRSHQKKVDLAYHLSYRSLLRGYYERFHTSFIKQIQESRKGIATRNVLKKKWPARVFENIGVDNLPYEPFFQALSSWPALVVTGSPLLPERIEMIDRLKDRALVVASFDAIPTLFKEGISPHFLFCPQVSTREETLLQQLSQNPLPFIYSDLLPSQFLKGYLGDKIKVMLSSDALGQYLYKKAKIPLSPLREGPSQLNILVDLLGKSRFQKILFLDLKLWMAEEVAGGVKVLGRDGQDIYSTGQKLLVKRVLEDQIKTFSSIEFLTLEDSGLMISGMNTLPLEEIDEVFSGQDLILDSISEIFSGLELKKKEYQKGLEDAIHGLKEDLQYILSKNKIWLKDLKRLRRYRERNMGVSKLLSQYRYVNSYFENLKEIPFFNQVMMKMLGETFMSIISATDYQGDDKMIQVKSLENRQSGFSVEIEMHANYLLSLIEDYQQEKDLEEFDF